MRKSNNYYKFMEYVAYGKSHDDTICKDNGVLECLSYATVEAEETEETTTRDTIETLPPHIYNDTDIDPVCMKCQDENLLPYNCNKCDNKKVRKNSLYGMFGESQDTERDRINYLMETHSFPLSNRYSYREVEKVCGDCSHFNACMQGYQTVAPTCCMFDSLYKARKNPSWHHVSLATLANLDFDMLDEKRQLYLQLYRELKELIKDLHKCKSGRAYERRLAKMYIRNAELLDENKISHDYINYVTRKVSMCNVECGLWTSKVEEATGLHKSRRYNRHVLKY